MKGSQIMLTKNSATVQTAVTCLMSAVFVLAPIATRPALGAALDLAQAQAQMQKIDRIIEACRKSSTLCGPSPAKTAAEGDQLLARQFGVKTTLRPISETQALKTGRSASGLPNASSAIANVRTMSLSDLYQLASDSDKYTLLPDDREVVVVTVLGSASNQLRIPRHPFGMKVGTPDYVTVVLDKRSGLALSRCFASFGSNECPNVAT